MLVGHRDHVEVEGTLGEAPESHRARRDVAEAEALALPDPERVAYITQTTLSVDDARAIVEALKRRFPAIREPAKDDICYATQNRQNAVKELARRCRRGAGGGRADEQQRATAWSRWRATSASRAHLIESAEDIRPEWLEPGGRGRHRRRLDARRPSCRRASSAAAGAGRTSASRRSG